VLSTAFVGFELANRFLRVFLFKISLPLRVFLVLAIWISAAITAGYICSFLPGVKEIIPQMALTFTGIMFLSALFSSLLMAQRESLKVLEKELTSTNASISWYIDRLNQSLSVEKKRISLLLHGDIQSQIVSVALNLQNKPNLEQNNLEVILENLQSSCVEALTVENKGTDPGAILESIVQVWRSNVQINLNYSIETLNRLKFDSIATVSAVEIVREAISNAVKHGKSSKIKINLEIDLDSNLQIEVQNNGLDYLPRKQAGLGTVVFNELTRKWSIQNTEGGVIFTGTVALAH
jgi:signal transduction histidine kinase